MSDKQVLLRNFSSLTMLQASNYIFPLITLPYLLRVLGPEKYGLMNFAAAFAGYVAILTDYGFNLSIPREISIHRNDKKKLEEIVSSVLTIKAVIFLISLVIYFILVFSIPRFSSDKEIYLLSVVSVVGLLLFPTWFFQGIEKMHFITIASISVRAAAVASIFIFINTTNDLALLIFINGFSGVLTGCISMYIIFKIFSIRFKMQGMPVLRHHLKEGLHLFISSISINLYTASSVFILGLLAGEKFVGYYTAADKIRIAVQNIFSSVTQTIFPHLTTLFIASVEDGLHFIKKVLKSAGLLNAFVCILIFIFSEQIIFLAGGPAYMDSVLVLRILSFLPFIIFLSNMAGVQIMLNLNYKFAFTMIIIFTAFLSLILSFILVPLFAERGTAVTMLITEIFVTVSMVLFVIRKIKRVKVQTNPVKV